jgi:hypothetical protein
MAPDCLQKADSSMASHWLLNGGYKTLKSYVSGGELDGIQGGEPPKTAPSPFDFQPREIF